MPLLSRGVAFRLFGLVAAMSMTILLIQACSGNSPLAVYGAPAQTFSISVGQALDIRMQTVGPGEYVSPPAFTGSAIEFLGESSPAGVANPAGVQQLFHFKGVAGGQAIILFHNTNPDGTHYPDVSDTVVVR